MSRMRITGSAFPLVDASGALLDNIDTDMIFHNRWLHITELSEMAQHALGNLEGYEDFAARVKPGSWVVAGRNFGAGSSRQQAVDCFKALGCVGVIAISVAPIYLRNAINAAMPAAQIPDLAGAVEPGDVLALDMEAGTLTNERTNTVLQAEPPISSVQVEIYRAGGLLRME
ncbi:3-isopropylmalate dehydratase [bacterium]|nr:3-isopropylmalate dehydratase [bacterium]